jgi:hypothetical protein
MQAIVVKYLGPTNFRGSRYKAVAQAGSLTLGGDMRYGSDENARRAADALIAKLGWRYGEWLEGTLPDGSYVYVCDDIISQRNRKEAAHVQA